MKQRQTAGVAFVTVGIAFIAIGASGQRAFLAIGAAFLALGLFSFVRSGGGGGSRKSL